ncbi:hypothetical protein DSO57_1007801 [Entomophthora muscae]|uniref:Uncharacterized protein n=1 Tax=Entomophthora muscae TaxID=34485 RepID=A0ACC2S912_9FUNG|nr:hypothetical protein DSO57_1007801 [Entomophthora muscae]
MLFFKTLAFTCACSALALPATDPKAAAKPAQAEISSVSSPTPASLGDKAAADARAQYARTIYDSVQQIVKSLVFGAGSNSVPSTPEALNAETVKSFNTIKAILDNNSKK